MRVERIVRVPVPCSVTITEPSECPLCGKAIKPQCIYDHEYQDNFGKWHYTALYLCNACYEPFLTHHKLAVSDDARIVYEDSHTVGPSAFQKKTFEQNLVQISPQFEKIYNQALAAEKSGLDEIAGMGYRKAVEFLIKDFLIYQNPDDKEAIVKMQLGNCIANKIPLEKLKTTAQKCAWLGNDQTHYIKKFEECDLQMLKRFIDATVYWIQMELVTQEADSLEKR